MLQFQLPKSINQLSLIHKKVVKSRKIMITSKKSQSFLYDTLVTTHSPALLNGAGDRLAFFAILPTFCVFGDLGNFLA